MRTVRFLVCLIFMAAALWAQENRATISGVVTDPSGAGIAGATLAARNTNNNLVVRATSAADGGYTLPKLPAGPYELSAEAQGFRKLTRTGVTLAVADNARVDIQLEIGALTESVTVTAELTGIETNQTVMGQLLDNKKVSQLPLNGRSFLTLVQLSAGVLFTPGIQSQGWSGTRQWESGPTDGPFIMHGGKSGTNAFLTDGAPMGTEGGTGWIPLTDAIDEVKVSTPTSDASLGLSGGGIINLTLKSGTNQYHGVASEFLRNARTDSLTTQIRRVNGSRTQHQWNTFSAMVGGPIIKNKWFFNGGYDGFREMVPYGQAVWTVPTPLQRAGDFSQTFNSQNQLIAIYDPRSTRQVGTGYVRDLFPGNKLPADRISTIAKNYLPFWPMPNQAGDLFTGTRNFLRPTAMSFQVDAWHLKSDYLWNNQHRTTATVSQSWGIIWGNTRGMTNDNPAADGYVPCRRVHAGATLEHTWTATPTMVVTGRLNWTRWYQFTENRVALAFNGSGLGYKGTVSPYGTHFPAVNVDQQMGLGGIAPAFNPYNNYFAMVDTFKTAGRHNIKFGGRITQTRDNTAAFGQNLGTFSFTPAFTQRNPQLGEPNAGYGVASFMLGYPASGSVAYNATSAVKNYTYSTYIQDDFKVNRKVTLNLGLRWDIQTSGVERFNRLARSFDPNASYTLNAVPVKGGLLFADNDHRTRYPTHFRDFQPRFGVAYNVMKKTVLRASYGLSMLPNNTQYGLSMDQTGFSRSTPYLATLGTGLNAYIPGLPGTGTWENPFPDGILQPTGSSLGLKTNVGSSVGYISSDYLVPRVHQFSFGMEHELPWKTTLEVAYVGSRTRKFLVSKGENFVPLDQQLKSLGDPNYWQQKVDNPFYGAPELVGTSYNTATLGIGTMMYKYPQFSQVTINGMPLGRTTYDSLEVRANKRMTQGFLISFSYTYSTLMTAGSYRTNWDTDIFRQADGQDRPHHLTMAAQLDFPIGKGKLLGKNWGGLMNGFLGGWQYNATVEKATGAPISMPGISLRDPLNPAPTDGRYFQTCTQLLNGTRYNCRSDSEPIYWRQANYNEITTYSTLWSRVRVPSRAIWNMSIFKRIPLVGERVHMELRGEFFNAFNTPQYLSSGTSMTNQFFGIVQKDQWNFPRNIQFAARILF